MLADFINPIAVFGCLFGIAYLYFTTRNRERMAMIEKGIGSELFISTPKSKPRLPFWTIKIGFLVLGIGLGLIFAVYFSQDIHHYNDKMVIYWASAMTSGGLGLIISFIIESIMTKKQK